MDEAELTGLSKFLSYVLRHHPEAIGVEVDAQGWADVEALIGACVRAGRQMDRAVLAEIVATDSKQRYVLSEDGQRIRAAQGHSLPVDLGLSPRTPPETLYHGTARRFLASILHSGLVAGKRHHVHLSLSPDAAREVGRRHGEPVVLRVPAGEMVKAGHAFYRSDNGVWLTDSVPPRYLAEFREGDAPPDVHEESAGGAVVWLTDPAKVLVMRTRRPEYELPKGHVEPGETALVAAERETREETGLMTPVEAGPALGSPQHSFQRRGVTIVKTVHYFVFVLSADSAPAFGRLERPPAELRWVTLPEVEGLPLVNENLRPVLVKALDLVDGERRAPPAGAVRRRVQGPGE